MMSTDTISIKFTMGLFSRLYSYHVFVLKLGKLHNLWDGGGAFLVNQRKVLQIILIIHSNIYYLAYG